jgi:hypothetical protein
MIAYDHLARLRERACPGLGPGSAHTGAPGEGA